MLLCFQKSAEHSHNDITNQSRQSKWISDTFILSLLWRLYTVKAVIVSCGIAINKFHYDKGISKTWWRGVFDFSAFYSLSPVFTQISCVTFGSIRREVFSSFVFIPQNEHTCSMGYILSFVIVCFLFLHSGFYKHHLIRRGAEVYVLVFQLKEISGPSVKYLSRIIKSFSLLSCCGTAESLWPCSCHDTQRYFVASIPGCASILKAGANLWLWWKGCSDSQSKRLFQQSLWS